MRSFDTQVRVRYEETDAMGIVYHSKYFVWFEVARTEALRETGFSYRKMEESGLRLVVIEASCRYVAPCRYDDIINIKTRLAEIKNTSLIFEYEVMRDEKQVAQGRTTHVFTDASSRPIKIPPELKEALTS